MPLQDRDISWAMLRQVVHDWAGENADLREFQPLAGGSISTTLALTLTDGRRAVLKITPHRVDQSYAIEARQLALLRSCGLPVPEVYATHVGSLDRPFSYLAMEFIPGVDLAAARGGCTADEYDALQRHLAELLLTLHSNTAPHFAQVGLEDARKFERWPDSYREAFDPIWRDVEKSGALAVKTRKTIARIHDRLDRLLAHDDSPRLVHWDIWASNLLARRDEAGAWRVCAVLDPNCRYAHAEAELAYMELFHTATPAFFKVYSHSRKLGPEYHQKRKPIYQLYSLLNHFHLFGPEYAPSVTAAVEKTAALV